MKFSFPSPEFDDAVAAVCHGSATDAEMRALNELLRSDSRARDEYLMRIALHTRLASDPDLFSQGADVAAGCPLPGISFGDRHNILALNPAVSAPNGSSHECWRWRSASSSLQWAFGPFGSSGLRLKMGPPAPR